MNRIITTALLAATTLAAMAQNAVYEIKGTCPENVKKVYMLNLNSRPEAVDSVDAVNGKFAFKGTQPKDAILGITTTGQQYSMFFNDGTPITANLTTGRLQGSPLNTKLNAYDHEIDSISSEANAIYAQLQQMQMQGQKIDVNDAATGQLVAIINEVGEKVDKRTREIIRDNGDNLIPAAFLGNMAYDCEYAELKELLDPKHAYANHPALAGAKRQLAVLEKKAKIIGTKFTDITENDTEGNAHKLSEYCGKGNYVLIDFWASWCGPCRQEMPNVKKNYEKYKSKGFNIVGLSFDNNKEAWKKAIADMGLEWTHLSDLKGWRTVAASTYGINSIPSSYLVGPDGTIIAADLRGEKLGEKLGEIYGF